VIPPEIDRVIMKGLAKVPGDRWQTADELAGALVLALQRGGLVASARPASSLSMGFGLSAMALLAVGLGAVFLWGKGPSPVDTGDGGTTDGAPSSAGIASTRPARVLSGNKDAGARADGGVGAPESPEPGPTMTAHDREEAAKDALAKARRAYDGEDWPAAAEALARAKALDPENPDVQDLERRLKPHL
ncbi:MAG: hypothetical protein KC416_02550, partial [Myxococcales bacterium]|nr:hypothetical protein [Myxococcales bacterium]